jgi:hypothetical protein
MKWVALLIFGGIGAAVLLWGLGWGLKRYALFRDGQRTTGTMVAPEAPGPEATGRQGDGGSGSDLGLVEFQTAAGQTIRFPRATGQSGSPEYQVGQKVVVLYDPADPHNAQIGTFSQLWVGPLVLLIFGALFLGAGIASFFLIRSTDRVFGDSFQKRVDRDMLVFQPDVLRIRGTVDGFRADEASGGKGGVVVCSGRITEGAPETRFDSEEIPAEFGLEIVGRPVMIFVDPKDHSRYKVDLDALLAEHLKRSPIPLEQ